MGPYVFGAQMLLDPTADDKQGFKLEWLRYAAVTTRGQNLAILIDPASKKKADSDYTSMWVIGLGPDRKVYVHDMLRDRLSLTERADTLIKLASLLVGQGHDPGRRLRGIRAPGRHRARPVADGGRELPFRHHAGWWDGWPRSTASAG
jgi:hypothetical protein